ncbi:sensor histidine kinase [Oceanirhabdus seepicola]|uniref:histidine kinase n=1 Tax=Oceanirhabdus seepicola TaxID=2828781 RepID=A0A9J6NV63_9CLOT|nr:sensor histidine kinase [Oceanirhabdus seepicola]MCM1988362.1 sensor histidine kinase [Oceanirhabdus seepicola]
MNFRDYLKDKIGIILLNISCGLALSVFLYAMGNNLEVIALILAAWSIVFIGYTIINYISRKKYFNGIKTKLDLLEQKYLISEMIEKPYRLEDKEYVSILRRALKSMTEQVNGIKYDRQEYKEYIESWIHEVKLPIASIQLMCENNKTDVTRKILLELRKMENDVEKALYYARSNEVWKDYMVQKIDMDKLVACTIGKNIQFFIQNGIQIEKRCQNTYVCTDGKWLEFIVNQLLVNSVKYKKPENSMIRIYTEEMKNGTVLVIEDNGIGIKESEINRIFDKNFVGSNGRKTEKSTGMGLYLSKKLCNKLGLEIYAESEIDKYTKITISFPRGEFILQN